MEFGTTFSAEWLGDIGALKASAIALDEAGIDFVSYGGHVLTAKDGRFDRPTSTYALPFRDPFVLYAHLAALTTRIRFRSGILILPMFPTVHVAKQAADLSLLSGGRFDLGVGISWNEAEYKAMGQEVSTRGRRLEEQLQVLKLLWTEPYVTFSGRFHEIDELGLGQLPESPIPIWVGCGDSDRSLSRVGRLADGWITLGPPNEARITALQQFAEQAGRGGSVGVTGRVSARTADFDTAVEDMRALLAAGVTAISISPPQGSAPDEGVAAVLSTRAHLVSALKG